MRREDIHYANQSYLYSAEMSEKNEKEVLELLQRQHDLTGSASARRLLEWRESERGGVALYLSRAALKVKEEAMPVCWVLPCGSPVRPSAPGR